jgi:hypothetical protein
MPDESNPMNRSLHFCTAAVMLAAPVAVPVAASAATAKHAAAKPAHHVTKASTRSAKHAAKSGATTRDRGAAAVDSLNDQALQRAKNGE